jgi:uncharacterized protein YaaQ
MRLVLAVVQSADGARVLRALTDHGYRVTRLASTGGFLREGNVTLLVGVADSEVDDVLSVIRDHAHSRTKIMAASDLTLATLGVTASHADWVEVTVGGAAVFVLDVARFERL